MFSGSYLFCLAPVTRRTKYCDNGGQVLRSVAAFLFKNLVTSLDYTLMGWILEEELPSLLRQFIEAYLLMAHDHPGGDDWKWCPEAS